ncbi:MAG: hypothetical protein RLZZ385_1525 [Pseudomonadota bacterium]
MDCPKCKGEFEEKKLGDLTINRCKNCMGLLIPAGSMRKLTASWESVTLMDVGSVKQGRKFDRIGDIKCPKCNIEMDKVEDVHQPHVWLETCPSCNSTFLDAGELTDLSRKTFSDKIMDLIKGRRH